MYQNPEALLGVKLETTYGTDAFSSAPTGAEWVKAHEIVPDYEQQVYEDDGASAYPPGWKVLPTRKRHGLKFSIEVAPTQVTASSDRPRGWAVLQAAGLTGTYSAPGAKLWTAQMDPSNVSSVSAWLYRYHHATNGASVSHWLDKWTGARTRLGLKLRNGIWTFDASLEAKALSRNNGATWPTAEPYIDTQGAYRSGLRFDATTFSLQDSAAGNVASGLIKDFTLDLGQELKPVYTSNQSGNPAFIDRYHRPMKGTMRLYGVSRAVSDPFSVISAGGVYVMTATAVDIATANNTWIMSLALSPTRVAETNDDGAVCWDVDFVTSWGTDGTDYGRTPSGGPTFVWSTTT